jgi:hypothetical protein
MLRVLPATGYSLWFMGVGTLVHPWRLYSNIGSYATKHMYISLFRLLLLWSSWRYVTKLDDPWCLLAHDPWVSCIFVCGLFVKMTIAEKIIIVLFMNEFFTCTTWLLHLTLICIKVHNNEIYCHVWQFCALFWLHCLPSWKVSAQNCVVAANIS